MKNNVCAQCGHTKLHHIGGKGHTIFPGKGMRENRTRFCDVKYCKCKGFKQKEEKKDGSL
jgi:hypothetical protein